MVDPVSVVALVFASMQYVLQMKTYLIDRKRRKRQEQLEQQQQQQHNQHVLSYHHASAMGAPPSPMITHYCICTYNIIPVHPNYYSLHALYVHPALYYYAPPPMALAAPPLISHHNGPASYNRSVNTSSSFTNYDASDLSSHASRPPYDWLGLLHGRMELHSRHQQAPVSSLYGRGTLGMRTGSWVHNNREYSYNHWKSLQNESTQGIQSIAVVDWSKGNIDMFMMNGGMYFRNYRISRCDVAMFARLFKAREVFSGEIKDKKLERFSKEMMMVEMRGIGIQSTNSWRSLGISDDNEDMQEMLSEQASFIRMVRGAVFGLVCCLYEDPCYLNVDMETAHVSGNLDIVRIHLPPWRIDKRDACIFSVFSFWDHGWAAQDILLG